MAVIIRLQNLPLTANTLDIRNFFNGLNIPEGGVHIVGGEYGDAFIGFGTDEDARQAMNMTGKKVKDARVKLLLSSRNEMQNVILAARERQARILAVASAATNGKSVPMEAGQNITGATPVKEDAGTSSMGTSMYKANTLNSDKSNALPYKNGSNSVTNNRRRSRSSDKSVSGRRSITKRRGRSPGPSKSRSRDRGNERSRERRRSRSRSKSGEHRRNSGQHQRSENTKFSTLRRDPIDHKDKLTPISSHKNNLDSSKYSDRERVGYTTSSFFDSTTNNKANIRDASKIDMSGNTFSMSPGRMPPVIPSTVSFNPVPTVPYPTNAQNEALTLWNNNVLPFNAGPTADRNFNVLPANNFNMANQNMFVNPHNIFNQAHAPQNMPFLNNPTANSVIGNNILPNPLTTIPNLVNNNTLNPPPLPFFTSHPSTGFNIPTPASNIDLQPTYLFNARNQNNLDNAKFKSSNPLTNQSSFLVNNIPPNFKTFVKYFVEVKNIPVEFRFGDIEDFFSDCDLWQGKEGIVEILGPRSESTDKVILRLGSENGYKLAMAKNGQRLPKFGNRVEILPSYEESWTRQKASHRISPQYNIEGSDSNLSRTPVKAYGDKFDDKNPISSGFRDSRERSSDLNGSYYRSAHQDSHRISPPPIGHGKSNRINDGFCIRLRNLTYEAKAKDVQKFFKDLPIINLHIETNDKGKSNGTAYVEFSNRHDHEAALSFHKMKLNDRSLLIEIIPKAEVIELVRKNLALKNNADGSNEGSDQILPPNQPLRNIPVNNVGHANIMQHFFALHVGCLPFSFSIMDLASMFNSHDLKPKDIYIVTKNGSSVGQAFVELYTLNEAEVAISRLNGLRIGPSNVIKVVGAMNPNEIKRHLSQFDHIDWPRDTRGSYENGPPIFNTNNSNTRGIPPFGKPMIGGLAPNFHNNGNQHAHMNGSLNSQPSFGSKTLSTGSGAPMSRICKVKIKNLPLEDSADDIIALFKPFHCIPHTLQIIHADGKPVGEAILGFSGSQYSRQAIDSMSGKPYKDKTLFLSILS